MDKYPNKPWDFEKISSNYSFDISWIDKYPNKPWDFSAMHKSKYYDIDWIDKYPNKPWNFQKISVKGTFDIFQVDKHPDKPWDFSNMHRCDKFDISWIDKYPDKCWDLCAILKSRLKKLKIKTKHFSKFKNLDNQEIIKSLHLISHIPICKIYNVWPGLFYQTEQSIELQDLSGDIFYLENWFYQNDILEYCKETFPELGEFDIAIDSQDGTEKLLMASTTAPNVFKSHLFQNPDGPQGMIVYL